MQRRWQRAEGFVPRHTPPGPATVTLYRTQRLTAPPPHCSHPDVALDYSELVLGGSLTAGPSGVSVGEAVNGSKARLVTDAEFWDEPRHRALLPDIDA